MIIDITNEVFTKIKTDLPTYTVLASYPLTTPIFPCIVFEEMSNITLDGSVDSDGQHHSDISFEVNIFSNTENKMTEVKLIRNLVDSILSDYYGMRRDYSSVTPNYLDSNIYRYTLRYTCVVSENNTIYRR